MILEVSLEGNYTDLTINTPKCKTSVSLSKGTIIPKAIPIYFTAIWIARNKERVDSFFMENNSHTVRVNSTNIDAVVTLFKIIQQPIENNDLFWGEWVKTIKQGFIMVYGEGDSIQMIIDDPYLIEEYLKLGMHTTVLRDMAY